MCGTPANCLAPDVVMEGVRVCGYHYLVDKFVDRRHRVRYVRHCSSVARTRLLICKEL